MTQFRLLLIFLLIGTALTGTSCRRYTVSSGAPEIVWSNITGQLGWLPSGISVHEGIDEETPLHAWYARIDLRNPTVDAHVMVSDDVDGQETTSELARDAGACLAVNGGYFVSGDTGSRHIGLLISGGNMIRNATTGIIVDDLRYPTARAAIGFFENGRAEVAWVTTKNDSVLAWPWPPANRPGHPGVAPNEEDGAVWDVAEALAAGPSLIHESKRTVTIEEEIFFNTPIPNVHPRTAAGVDHDGALLLVVVDGRQPGSRGVSLPDLATILLDLGAEFALNLDGGGSSSFVVNGRLLNQPGGSLDEREVVSGISIQCHSLEDPAKNVDEKGAGTDAGRANDGDEDDDTKISPDSDRARQ